MTPLHLQMMLHYYSIAEPYAIRDPQHAGSPAVARYRDDLLRWGLIHPDEESDSGFFATEKGKAFVDFLLETPLPVCKWVRP